MRLLNKNTARRAAAAAALLTMTAAMSVGAFAADAEDVTVAGYLPPQSSEVMVQGDIALHSDVPVGEVDPNYGGYASPVENPIQGNVMMISDETPLPSDTPVEKSEARYTVKGLLGKQVLYTARQEGRVLTLDAPDDNATFRTTILDMQTLMNQGVSTLVLKTGKTSTTLNLTLLCQDQKPGTRVTLRHLGSSAHLTSPWASAAAATSSLADKLFPLSSSFSIDTFPSDAKDPRCKHSGGLTVYQMVPFEPFPLCSDA